MSLSLSLSIVISEAARQLVTEEQCGCWRPLVLESLLGSRRSMRGKLISQENEKLWDIDIGIAGSDVPKLFKCQNT